MQAPTCSLYLCHHFVVILLSVWENHFHHKQIKKRNYRSPVCLLPRAALAAASCSPGSLSKLALAMVLRSVSPQHWRSSSQRSRSVASGRWCSTTLFNPADVLPSCSSDWVCRVFYFTLSQPSAVVALVTHSSRSFDWWLLSH